MRALVVDPDSPGRLVLDDDYPDPRPGPGELLLRVSLAGICATDLEILRGYMDFRGVLGHEFVGVVVAGPPEWRSWRVVAEINCLPPEALPADWTARKHDPRRSVLGIAGRDGVFAELVSVPLVNCRRVPEALSDRQAVFAEPLAAACQVLEDVPVDASLHVAVLGAGRLGLLCGQVLKAAGAQPLMLVRQPRKAELCRRLGLPAVGEDELRRRGPFDLLIECTGNPAGLELALELARPRGTIVLKSTYADRTQLNAARIVVDELRLVGSRCGPLATALRLLAEGGVQVESLIEAVYPLTRYEEAFAAASRPGALKVLLDPSH